MADLLRWAFATVHTGLFVLVAVWLAHLADALGDLLVGLDTALGLGLYAVLWAITWWATGRAFDAVPPGTGSLRERATAGFLYGALTGAGFLLVVVVGAFLATLAGGGQLLPILFVGLVGTVLALLVGGTLGVVFALLDAPLVRVGARLVPREQ